MGGIRIVLVASVWAALRFQHESLCLSNFGKYLCDPSRKQNYDDVCERTCSRYPENDQEQELRHHGTKARACEQAGEDHSEPGLSISDPGAVEV